MSLPYKKVLWVFVFLIAVITAFALGRWSGSFKASLEQEVNYPWPLHKKLTSIDTRCEKLRMPPQVGKFFVQATDGGETLLISALNERTETVNAFAINSAGQMAADSWTVDCK